VKRARRNKGKAPDRAENDSGEYSKQGFPAAWRICSKKATTCAALRATSLPETDHIKARRSSSPLFMICFGAKNHERRRRVRGEGPNRERLCNTLNLKMCYNQRTLLPLLKIIASSELKWKSLTHKLLQRGEDEIMKLYYFCFETFARGRVRCALRNFEL
jgi:hypothetical protein